MRQLRNFRPSPLTADLRLVLGRGPPAAVRGSQERSGRPECPHTPKNHCKTIAFCSQDVWEPVLDPRRPMRPLRIFRPLLPSTSARRRSEALYQGPPPAAGGALAAVWASRVPPHSRKTLQNHCITSRNPPEKLPRGPRGLASSLPFDLYAPGLLVLFVCCEDAAAGHTPPPEGRK